MRLIYLLSLLSLGISACEVSRQKSPPNIVYILADDLGYGELGVYGQEKIKTPNIDNLAKNGILFTRHYSGAPVCAPARYMLLTGKHPGHAHVRGNDEWAERGDVWNYEKAVNDPNLEGQRPIPDSITLATMLKKAGYKTALVGKWGLGGPLTQSTPTKKGFDFFYGYNCQRQAHQLYPRHLWKNEEKVWLDNELVVPNTKLPEGSDPNDQNNYDIYEQSDYAPALMHREALKFIEENKEGPFFLYYASPLPHVPLQVPRRYVEKYTEAFGEEQPYAGDKGYFPSRYPNATYAGMISYLDNQVGEIVTKLKELGLYENTMIIFTSDNGPTYAGGVDPEFFNSAGPFENGFGRTKGFTYEGGIRVPMIAQWPAAIEPGSRTEHVSVFWDVMATLGELTGASVPDNTDGISFLPTLLGKTANQQKHNYLYWEFAEYGGQQAVLMDNWKAVRKDIRKGNLAIELYDLNNDQAEQNNIAELHPDIVKKIDAIMKKEHTPAEVESFRMEALDDQ